MTTHGQPRLHSWHGARVAAGVRVLGLGLSMFLRQDQGPAEDSHANCTAAHQDWVSASTLAMGEREWTWGAEAGEVR